MTEIEKKYDRHRRVAKQRGVDFLLTFDQWWNIWQQSGKWNERGNKRGQYVMSRYGDVGPYSVDNVFIQLHSQNTIDAHKDKPKTPEHSAKISATLMGRKQSPEHSAAISAGKKGKPKAKATCPHCGKEGAINNMSRWHNDNCKEKVYV